VDVSEKVEGTIGLDGLIEGQLPPEIDDFEDRLRDWVRLLAKLGVKVELEVDGSSFNLLASPHRVAVSRLGGPPAEQIGQAVEQLAQAFPDVAASQVFSTLRSVEYRPGEEVQTVYVIRPDGTVETPQRSVEAKTSPPPRPPTGRERLRVFLGGLALIAIVFGVSSLFVDYGSLFRSLWHRVVPIDAEALEVDDSRFAEYFRIAKRQRGTQSKFVRLTLVATPRYPTSLAAFEAAYAEPGLSFHRRLTLDALARGYVTVEIFDGDGRYLGSRRLRIRALGAEGEMAVDVYLPRDPRPERLVLTW